MQNTNLALAPKVDDKNLYESLALRGDLSGLKPEEKAIYYKQLCDRLGLDATTKPFDILKLNGKEVMYPTKGATDQLARIHNVNRRIIEEKEMRGVYIVTCEASLPNGRCEQSKGVVTIENAKGDALCNSIMKAETKAKRRATLSILGLAMLDESELETIPANRIEYPHPPTKAQLVEQIKADNDPLDKQIAALCSILNKENDSIKWSTKKLAEYACEILDVENFKDADDEMKNVLIGDLEGRLEILRETAAISELNSGENVIDTEPVEDEAF